MVVLQREGQRLAHWLAATLAGLLLLQALLTGRFLFFSGSDIRAAHQVIGQQLPVLAAVIAYVCVRRRHVPVGVALFGMATVLAVPGIDRQAQQMG